MIRDTRVHWPPCAQAKNGAGWSGFSATIAVKIGATHPPSHEDATPLLVGTPGCDALTVRWAAPQAHGTPLISHRVEWTHTDALTEAERDGEAQQHMWASMTVPLGSGGGAEARVEGLDGGITYSIRIASQNLLGWGPPSTALVVATPIGPRPPTTARRGMLRAPCMRPGLPMVA